MTTLTFNFDRIELEAIQMLNGEWVFHAQTVLLGAEILKNKNHCADWIRTNVPSKWVIELKLPGKMGRPSLYFTEAGMYFVVAQAKTMLGYWLRDRIFEEVLPAIRKQGYYLDKDALAADTSKLEALQSEVNELKTLYIAAKENIKELTQTLFADTTYTVLCQYMKRGIIDSKEATAILKIMSDTLRINVSSEGGGCDDWRRFNEVNRLGLHTTYPHYAYYSENRTSINLDEIPASYMRAFYVPMFVKAYISLTLCYGNSINTKKFVVASQKFSNDEIDEISRRCVQAIQVDSISKVDYPVSRFLANIYEMCGHLVKAY